MSNIVNNSFSKYDYIQFEDKITCCTQHSRDGRAAVPTVDTQ